MIRGPLGLLCFVDTMNDEFCVQPIDLIELHQELNAEEVTVVKVAA